MFDLVEHKLGYLSERYSRAQMNEWCELIADTFAANGVGVTLAPGIVRSVCLDACYCVARHLPWANTALFRDLFVEVLVDEYGLNPAIAGTIHQQLCQSLQIEQAVLGQTDQETVEEFLKFIFVQSVCATDDNELMRDLGFGEQLLRRLRRTAQSTISKKTTSVHSADTNDTHAPLPAEEIFSRIMIKMSQQVRRLPWIVDLYRLQFMLFGPGSKHTGKTSLRYSKILFRMLLLLGRRRTLTERKLEAWLTQRLNPEQPHNERFAARQILEQMQTLQLIYRQQATDTSEAQWALAKAGLALTAEAFAIITTRRPIENHRLLNLPPIYQATVIKHLPAAEAGDQARELLLYHAQTLSPPGLEQCVLLLAKTGDHQALAEHVISLITHIPAPWSKAALYKALTSLPALPCVGQRLAAMAQSESSPRVKQAASEAAARHAPKNDVDAKVTRSGEPDIRFAALADGNP